MRDEELFKSFQKFQPEPDAPETSDANVPQDTADDDRGFFSNVVRVAGSGADTTSTGMRLSGDVVTGEFDENAPALISRELTRKKPRPKELVEAQQNLSRFSEDWEKADGFWESTGVVGKMLLALGQEAVTNPKGAVYFTSEQVANMVPGLLAMKMGTLVGAATGPLAPVAIPALATGGMFAGGYLVEAGLTFLNEVGEELQVRQMEPTEENVRSVLADEDFTLNSLERARRKAFGTAGVDTVMTMLGAKFAGKPGRMAHKAAISKVGVDAPVDMLKKATKEAYKAIPLRTKAARGVGGWAMDTAGEGISEGYGDFAATGAFDMGEVAMEMFGAMGTSVAEVPAVVRTLGHHAKKGADAPADATVPPETTPKKVTEKKEENVDILAGDVPGAPKSEPDEVNLLLGRRKVAEEQGVPFAEEDQARLYELEVGGPLEEDRQAIQDRALGTQPVAQPPIAQPSPEVKNSLPVSEPALATPPALAIEPAPVMGLPQDQGQITREQYDAQAKLAIPSEKPTKKIAQKPLPTSEEVIAKKGADVGLNANQLEFVTKRVQSLGSVEAVRQSYTEKSPIDEFANWYAEKIYGKAGGATAPANVQAEITPETTVVPPPAKAKGTKTEKSVTKSLNEAATNRVMALGSIDAVNELHSTNTATDKLMRKIAQEVYGGAGTASKKPVEKVEQKPTPVEEKKPTPKVLKRNKGNMDSRGAEGVKALDRVYQSKEKEWGDNKKNPVYEAYLDVYDAVEQDGKSIGEAISGIKDQATRDSVREAVSTTLGLNEKAPTPKGTDVKAPQKKGLKKKSEKTDTAQETEPEIKNVGLEEAIRKTVEAPNTTDEDIVELLSIALRKINAAAADKVEAVKTPDKSLSILASAMKKLFGVRVVYTRGLHVGGLSSPLFANVLFVNLEHGHRGYYAQVMGHELLHAMEWRDPLLYRHFKHILLRFMKNTTEYMAKYNAAVRDLNESGNQVGGELSYRLAMDELIADVLGARIADPEFWAGLEKHAKNAEEKGIIRKVAESLRALVKQIVDYFTDNREYAPSQYIDRLTEIDETLYTFLSMQTTDKTFKSDPNKNLVDKIRKEQDKKKYALRQGITAEVAPNPDNEKSAARFDALTWKDKWGVTEKLAKEIVPVMMNMFGVNRYHMELTIGGFQNLVNPSVVLTFPMTTPYELVVEAGKTLGTIWRQKSIITYNEHITTGDNVSQFVKVVPDNRMTQEQAENFFRTISNEYAPAEGMVHRDRALVFGNFSGVSKEEFINGISEAVRKTMAGQNAILLDANFRSDYIEPVSVEGTRYENQIREVGQEEKRIVLWGDGGRGLGALWASSDSLLEKSLSEAEKGPRYSIGRGQQEAVANPDQRGEPKQQPRTRIEDALGTRRDGRIVLKHYSKEPRAILSTHFVGYGIEGAEKKKRQNYPDLYLNPIFFAMPNLYSMEDALRSMEWEHDVSVDPKKLYDWREDPDGIVQKAIDKVRQETGALDHSYAVATANRMIYEAGYVGLYETTDPGQQAMVILWHSVTPEVAVNVRTGERRELSKKSSIVLSSQAPAPTSSKPSVMGPKKIAQALITELKKRGHNDLASWKLYREGDPLYQHPEVKRAMQDLGFAKNALPVKSAVGMFDEKALSSWEKRYRLTWDDLKELKILRPAMRLDGVIYTAEPGEIHSSAIEQYAPYAMASRRSDIQAMDAAQQRFYQPDVDDGYVTADGEFMSRKEAFEWIKANDHETYRLIKEEVEEFGYLDSQTYAEAKGLEGDFTVRYQLVSSRVPTAVGTPGDIHTTLMYTDREVFERDPNLLEKTVEVLTGYAPFSDIVGPPEEGLQKIIERVSGTLEWLYDKARPDLIDRSKKWYEGAHRVASMWADESGLSLAQTAGILAALSPQKDWHINVGLAERVIDFVTKLAATATWTKEMSQLVEGLPISEGITKELKDQITGKAYREMEDYSQKALWLRVYDQAHNPQVTRVLTPEGNFADLYRNTNKDRTPKTLLWSTVRDTAKAVSIAENGSIKNISDKIGKGNKVRNFYNNIFNPANDRFVTIDTHAVSAGFMYPVKSGMTESYNLFRSPSSTSTGATGTYAVIAEAHRLAASRKGVMTRELQSVVWGVGRSLFNQVKGQKKDKIMAIWEDFRDGKTTYETARERVYDESGGITDPEWEPYGPDFTVDGEKPLSSYKENLPRTGLHARRDTGASAGRVRDAGGFGVRNALAWHGTPHNVDRFSTEENPDVRYSLPNIAKPTVDQESYGQVVSRLITNENRASAWRDMLDSFVEFWQDKFLSLRRTQEAILEKGWEASFEELPYSVLELKNSKIKNVTTKFMTEHIEPLQKAIIKSGLTMREIGLYLYARHAPSRNAYLKVINDGKKDLSGMSDQRATQILQQYQADGRAAKMGEVVSRVDAMVAYERSLIRDNNLEPDSRIDAWTMFVNYVPLKGLDGNNTDIDMTHSGKGINFAGSNIRRTLGREGMADPRGIVPNLVAQIMGNIVRSEEVKVQRSFLNMVRQNPDPGLWQIYKKGLNAAGKYIRTYAANPKFVSLVRERKGLEKKLKEAVSAHDINDLTQKIAAIDAKLAVTPRKKVITRPDPKMAELPNVLTVTDTDGTAVYIEIMNRRLADALKNASWNTQGITIENPDYARLKDEENALAKRIKAETDPAKLADLRRDFTAVRGRLKGIPQVKVVSRPGGLFQGTVAPKLMSLMRFMSAMRTSYDPEFVISNFSKDMQTAMVHLVGEQARGLAWKVAKEVPQAISGILRARFNRRPSVYSDWYERFQSAGGEISFNEMVTAEDVQKRIEHLIDVAKPGMSLAKFREGLADRIKVVEDINSSVENGVRLAAFKNLVESGMNETEAASIAKNLTVNFEKKGKAGTFLQMTYIFANAGIQGNARMIMSLAKSKVSRRIAAGAFSMGLMLGFMNAAIGEPDDEDETNAWDRIDDGTKGRNILVIDKNGNAYKVPMAYGYGFFVAAGYAMSEFLRGKKSVGEFASVVSASAIDNYLPVSSGPTILQTVAPTLAQPAVDLYLNKNFMGNPIYPDNPFDKRPDSQKSFGSTGIIAKWTAEQINAIFGGSKYEKSSVDEADIYPDALEHVFEFITGGPGKMLRNVAELPSTIQDISGGDWDKMGRVPFSRKVFSPVTTRYDESMFYERIRRIESLSSGIKQAQIDGNKEAANDIRRRNPEVILVKRGTALGQGIAKQRKRMKAAEERGDKETARKIKQSIVAEMKKFNSSYEKLSK